MDLINLRIKKLNNKAIIPEKGTSGSAGYDLRACIDESVLIRPGDLAKIGTGISIEIPDENVGGFVFARSGLATKHGIIPVNCVGVIDSDYRGEIIVVLKNTSNIDYELQPNDRIAQLVFLPIINWDKIELVDELNDSDRGSAGFGSTGV